MTGDYFNGYDFYPEYRHLTKRDMPWSTPLRGTPELSADIDPVTFEILRNALVAAVDEMGVMLEKVAFSLVVSEGRDFSTSISDKAGDLIADGTEDLPTHVGTLPFAIRAILDQIGEANLKRGDLIIMNDPYLGGTHCQDFRMVMPFYWESELIAMVHSSVHLSDAGGRVPGSFQIDARSAYEEALYVPPIHLVREGVLDNEVLALILRNIRVPDVSVGDITAMVEACRTGEARMVSLFAKYGRDLMVAEMEELKNHSRSLLEKHFSKLKEGTYHFTDFIDYDPGVEADERERLPVVLEMTVEKDRVIYDFSRSAGQTLGAVNIPRALLWSAVVVATKAIFPDVPVNQGIYNAVEVVAPDGLIVTAAFPAATSAGVSNCYEKVTGCILGCFLQVLPERSMAANANISNFVLGGVDPRPGRGGEFLMYDWTAGGYGARPGKKDNHSAMSLLCSGTRNQPIEMMERAYPVIFDGYGFIPDSPGPGRHRGGMGIYRSFELTHGAYGVISVVGDREEIPAWGFDGGQPGNLGDGLLYKAGTDDEVVVGVKRSGFPVAAGWKIRYWEGGGGGYQEPWRRPVEWVLEDVQNGYVTVEGAKRDYSTVIETTDERIMEYSINQEATEDLRSKQRAGS
ncbi:MAG: hypothetical protein GEU71_00585 [Actinobacteria bacterium]|nr:hypothetical protein [Actinomycetota bacterium]